MKKYKLKKWYPSCLDLKEGDVITKWTGQTGYSFNRRNSKFFNPTEIENNPEFWQEVVEKDYEIISLISPTNTVVKNITIEKCIKSLVNQGFNIHSIKRLSDGEVFTVNDRIKIESLGYTTIKSFFINDNNKILLKDLNNANFKLEDIQHVKKPLFITDFEVTNWLDDKENFHIGDTILSVKRKSDNVQFKIGDRIKEGTIIKIIIKKDKIYLEV